VEQVSSRGSVSVEESEVDFQPGILSKSQCKQAHADLKANNPNSTFPRPGGPGETDAHQAWAKHVIDAYGIKEGQNAHGTKIELRLDPNQFENYHALQHAIAKLIPVEMERPMIDLTIQGESVKGSNGPQLVILGGTGPISDAEILKSTMTILRNPNNQEHVPDDQINIRLRSSPPARGKAGGLFAHPQKFGRFTNRAIGSALKTGHPASKIVLASNTAHANIGKVKGFNRVFGHGLVGKGGTTVDMTVKVANVVTTKPEGADNGWQCRPLVLGTTMAYDYSANHDGTGGLYPKLFQSQHGVNAAVVEPGQLAHGVESEPFTTAQLANLPDDTRLTQSLLQNFIDDAKKHGHNEAAGNKLTTLIEKEVERQNALEPKRVAVKNNRQVAPEPEPLPPVSDVILACTELPLALGQANIEKLKDLNLPSGGKVRIIDTEHVFAENYAQLMHGIANNANH